MYVFCEKVSRYSRDVYTFMLRKLKAEANVCSYILRIVIVSVQKCIKMHYYYSVLQQAILNNVSNDTNNFCEKGLL